MSVGCLPLCYNQKKRDLSHTKRYQSTLSAHRKLNQTRGKHTSLLLYPLESMAFSGGGGANAPLQWVNDIMASTINTNNAVRSQLNSAMGVGRRGPSRASSPPRHFFFRISSVASAAAERYRPLERRLCPTDCCTSPSVRVSLHIRAPKQHTP